MQRLSTVLDTKVRVPRQSPGMLLRPHLLNALHDHIGCNLQFVIAPAGFGKTTLLVDFVHEASFTPCWATLDATDRDLTTFVETAVAAIRHTAPQFGARTLASLHRPSDVESQASVLARLLVLEFQQQVDALTVVVLDDYHEVDESAPVTQFMNELLRVLPDTLRIVIAGRSLPSLTISRLLVEGRIFGLGETDLRFSSAELLTLLHRQGHTVTADQAAAVVDGAEGWIAGFLLSVPQLWQGLISGMVAGSGGGSPLYDYLAAEAFDRQPPDVQHFLLVTSVPQVVDTDLATALLGAGDWSAMVDRLERAGLFVTRLPPSRSTFRYHQLFREFLQIRLRRTDPDKYARLHSLTATHLAARDAWPAALKHLREAGKEPEAAALLAQIAPDLERTSRWRALADAVAGLPLDASAAYPLLMLSAARAALHTGNLPQAETLAGRARDVGMQSDDQYVEAWGLTCLGHARRLQGKTAEALALFEHATVLAVANDELLAVIRRHIGKCLGVQGDFAGAAMALSQALTYFDQTGATYDAAQAEFGLGVALAKSGRVAEAITCYESASVRWRELGDTAMEAEMLNCLGCAYGYRGDYPRARAELEQALARAYDGGYPLTQAATHHSLAEVLLAAGDVTAARRTIEQGLTIAREIGESWVVTHLYDALALTTAFEGDLLRAEEHAQHAVAVARRQESRYLEALCSVTLGAILARLGRTGAVPLLQDAAEILTGMSAQREMVRAHLWLAQVHLHAGAEAVARRHLDAALHLTQALGSDGTLDVHARWDASLFERFSAEGVASQRLDAVLDRVRTVLSPTAVVTSNVLPGLMVRAFGPGVLLLDETREVVWSWEKTRELFFYLLHHGPRRREQLTAALWPDSSPDRAKATLHTSVYRLRRAVHPEVILLRDGVYRINEELVTFYDVREFERLVRTARTELGDTSVSLLQEASGLYTAPFLEDIHAEWCTQERDRLQGEQLACFEALIDAEAAAGRWRESINVAERLLTLEPFREDIHARVIRSYLRLGDHVAARRQLDRCRAILWDELKVTPGASLQELQKRVQP